MIDEVLARYSGQGQRTLLTDALGSVTALSDDSGTVTGEYSYSPFGETEVTGEESDNPLQYTGRENDGTGLYYYRARYYDPGLKRFISSDPIGLDGGINIYLYALANPLIFSDPKGLDVYLPPGDEGEYDFDPVPGETMCEKRCWLAAQALCTASTAGGGLLGFGMCATIKQEFILICKNGCNNTCPLELPDDFSGS